MICRIQDLARLVADCKSLPLRWINRIYYHFVQRQGNPPECQRFAVHDEACRVVEVAYLWHEGGFPCPCTNWWLIIFLLSPLITVRNPLFYLTNYYKTSPDHKTAQTRCHVIVKVMTSLYDHHFRFVHNGVVGDNPLEISFWIFIKRMDIRVWGRRIPCPCRFYSLIMCDKTFQRIPKLLRN